MDTVLYTFWKFTDWVEKWDSGDWAAIGQWLGAIATFWAVLISLKATRRKPHLKISSIISLHDYGNAYVEKLNIKVVPFDGRTVKIEHLSVSPRRNLYQTITNKRKRFINIHGGGTGDNVLPRSIQPHDYLESTIGTDIIKRCFEEFGYSKMVTLDCFAYDSLGYTHRGGKISVNLQSLRDGIMYKEANFN